MTMDPWGVPQIAWSAHAYLGQRFLSLRFRGAGKLLVALSFPQVAPIQ
ncbi:Uncharacterised protein [Mycobacteroides abscessus subsp. massiliense]|nr:Uncharacterised protein [Mycobacteroides abscessus subsp. massiliense]